MCDITVTAIVSHPPDEGYTLDVYELHGVPYRPGLEESIRQSHHAWLAAGAAVEQQRQNIINAIFEMADNLKGGILP